MLEGKGHHRVNRVNNGCSSQKTGTIDVGAPITYVSRTWYQGSTMTYFGPVMYMEKGGTIEFTIVRHYPRACLPPLMIVCVSGERKAADRE